MEMLVLFGVCALAAVIAGIYGWQTGRQTYHGATQIEPPPPEGVPVRPPDLTGDEPCCR